MIEDTSKEFEPLLPTQDIISIIINMVFKR